MVEDVDVVVVGAGLAGLACARELTAAGRRVVVVERAERVGGRVTSDEIDGFTVDRGFQVLNPAYPHLRAAVDLERLDLHPFERALRVRRDDGLAHLADPFRHPAAVVDDVRTGLVTPAVLGLAPFLLSSALVDRPRGRAMDRSGVRGSLRREVIDAFLAGVVCEDDGSTSARFTAWLMGMFALGTPGVPARGMRALPEVMAEGLDVRLEIEVTMLAADGRSARTSSGDISCREVVVAAGPAGSATLVGAPVPTVHGTCTFWFGIPGEAPSDTSAIHVDGRRRGPVVTTSVVSLAAPTYAPPGHHLVTALTLSDHGTATEAEVRAHLGAIFGCATDSWQLVARHDIPETLPAVPPPYRQRPRARRWGAHILCGDQMGNASLDGAVASGQAAARLVLDRATAD